MLKLTYTETSCHLDYLPCFLEDWVSQRAILALRVGTSVAVEPSTASFLVSTDLPLLKALKMALKGHLNQIIELTDSEAGFLEVSISGSWLLEVGEADAGIFVTSLGDNLEMLIFDLWQASMDKSPSPVRD